MNASPSMNEIKRRGWRRSWSFVAAATGATIGLGNLWKFSYLAGENGGAAFVLAYLFFVLMVAMPVMMAEVLLGSRGRANPVTTMRDLSIESAASPWWQLIGWMGALAGLLVLSYYSVIAGWGMAYVGKMISGDFTAGSAQLAGDGFNEFLADPRETVKWQSIYLLVILLVLIAGVRRGVGLAARAVVPLLFVMLIALVVYSSRVGDMDAALDFMFVPDMDALTSEAVLVALGQAFFSLSIGVGAMMAYGAYCPDKRSITGMVGVVVTMDTLVSLLAGLAIFPLVFSFNIAPSMGPGLMFVAMPYGFGNMLYGNYFGALFFVAVSLAAIVSGVALLEPATVWLKERLKCWRALAALIMVALVWVLGLVVNLSFTVWADIKLGSLSVFALFDFVTANLLLPIGGLLIAIFVGWVMRPEVLRDELYVEKPYIFWLWHWVLRYIAAPGVLVVFAASLYRFLV